jgi:hypothetical protein
MKEKRLLPRMNVVTHYKITESNADKDLGRVTDISTEGMRLQGPESLEVNTTSTFEMTVPQEDNTNDSLLFDARVIWSRESSTPGMYDTGIRMWSISSDDRNCLQQIVDSIPDGQQQLEELLHSPFRY